jgi:hypothetical protein
MSTLKERIQHEVSLLEPKFLEHAFSVARKFESIKMVTRRVAINNYTKHHVPSPNLTQPTRLTPQHMDERKVLHPRSLQCTLHFFMVCDHFDVPKV